AGHKGKLAERLWAVLEQPGKGHEDRRLRAAAALAAYDRDGRRWDEAAGPVVGRLGEGDSASPPARGAARRPVPGQLPGPRAAFFCDRREEHTAERFIATGVLADYAADRPEVLAELLLDADERQWAALWPKLQPHGKQAAALMQKELQKVMPPEDQPEARN